MFSQIHVKSVKRTQLGCRPSEYRTQTELTSVQLVLFAAQTVDLQYTTRPEKGKVVDVVLRHDFSFSELRDSGRCNYLA